MKSPAAVDRVKHHQSEAEKNKRIHPETPQRQSFEHHNEKTNTKKGKDGEHNADFYIKVNLIRINQKIN